MSDRDKSNRPSPQPSPDSTNWHRHVCREVLYIAGLLRVYSHRLELLADALPLPDQETVQRVLGAASQLQFDAYPALSLHVDLGTLAHDLADVAEKLTESAETNLPPEDDDV